MWTEVSPVLAVIYLLYWIPPPCVCHLGIGRPKLTGCRSPEKETFSCWWEPGSAGGLPTTYRLFYRKERSEKVFECPDYHRAGNNSCFFDKAHTSIWVIYNITVMASNANGSTFSEPVEVDVMDIVQPYSPENVTLTLMGAEDNLYFLVRWEPPHDTDTRSGWITLKYEVRVKLESEELEQSSEWEVYNVGKQNELSIYSPQPGGQYTVQVHCKLDQGLWSEWTPPTCIKIPNNSSQDRQIMFFIVIVCAVIALVTVGVLIVKRKHVKHCLLPPVPGPKIKGLDSQPQKTEKSEDLFHALNFHGTLPTPPRPDNFEYLIILNSANDDDVSEIKTYHECEHTGQNSSNHANGVQYCDSAPTEKTWNQLDITQDDQLKNPFLVLVHDCWDSDPEAETSRLSDTFQLSHHFSTHDVSQQELDLYQDESQDKPHKNIPVMPTTEKEDYSKVSGIYSDTVLVLGKDTGPILKNEERHHDNPSKKSKDEKSLSVKDATYSQEYVVTL